MHLLNYKQRLTDDVMEASLLVTYDVSICQTIVFHQSPFITNRVCTRLKLWTDVVNFTMI